MSDQKPVPSRRRFLAAAPVAALGGLNLITSCKAPTRPGSGIIVGEGEHQYEVIHSWGNLPDKYTWQITHNVAVDSGNRLYVIHEGDHAQQDHPAIFVFDEQGDFIKAFGNQFQGGGHGLEVRKEADGEFLYVTGYQMLKTFAKLTLDGEVVWQKYAPMESGVYAKGEDTNPEKVWGRDRFMPTNFAFLDDGGYFLAVHDEDAVAVRPRRSPVHGDELLPHSPEPVRVHHFVQRRDVPAKRDVRHVRRVLGARRGAAATPGGAQ
jgi:hypothetical protein